MEPTEITFIFASGDSFTKDVYLNSFVDYPFKGCDTPRVIMFHIGILNRIGYSRFLEVCEELHELEYYSKSTHYILTDGVNIYSDPLSLGQVIDIQMNHNGWLPRRGE